LLNHSATSKSSTGERPMKLVVRKLEIPDLGQLQSLVIEHLDSIEPGLTVLDSRLLLGHANVDIVALDAEGALVLVTAGFTADEDMVLGVP
jgi:RecB family endonuclease NucS